ncbi:MAG: response regulator [Elusimicrobiota bacterium]
MSFLDKLSFWKKRILVADDTEEVRELVREILMMGGYRVVVAKDGLEAISLIRRMKFDAIILDVNMPGADGIKVIEALRAFDSRKDTPVLMLTADKMIPTANKAFELGVKDYIGKPFAASDLIEKVRRLL